MCCGASASAFGLLGAPRPNPAENWKTKGLAVLISEGTEGIWSGGYQFENIGEKQNSPLLTWDARFVQISCI